MIVYYDPATLVAQHTITMHDATYDPTLNGEHYVEHPDPIAYARIFLTKDASGAITVSAKKDMPVALLASPVKLGTDAMFLNVPEGAAITVNGAVLGTMDASGSFDFEATTTGFFVVTFTLAGFMDWSETLEVVSGT